jgi:dTMP kinase
MKPGKFITFEGIDGAGKSTHVPFVTELVRSRGLPVVCTREPGGTTLGETLRQLLLHHTMHIETEALLMFAARREHLAQVIQPALSRGDWVISDRFTDASYAYQGGGRKLSLDKLAVLEHWVHPELQPDLTLLFDLPPEIARQRLDNNREPDKFEQEKSEFFQNTQREYLRRAAEFPDRFRVIDASLTIHDIEKILEKILLTI